MSDEKEKNCHDCQKRGYVCKKHNHCADCKEGKDVCRKHKLCRWCCMVCPSKVNSPFAWGHD